jgi:uncharacterized OsmC-like protein
MTTPPDLRRYTARAASTTTFGRVLVGARDQHLVVDGPVANGCPGEAITPGELFLSAVAACGVELIQVLAKGDDVPLQRVDVVVEGVQNRDAPVRPDVSLFNSVKLEFQLAGVTESQGRDLVERFKRR